MIIAFNRLWMTISRLDYFNGFICHYYFLSTDISGKEQANPISSNNHLLLQMAEQSSVLA